MREFVGDALGLARVLVFVEWNDVKHLAAAGRLMLLDSSLGRFMNRLPTSGYKSG